MMLWWLEITNIDNIVHTGGGGFLTYTARTTGDNSNDPRLLMKNLDITKVVPTASYYTMHITGTSMSRYTVLFKS